MRILFLDIETTGLLPKNIYLNDKTVNEYPHIVQMSYVIFNTDTKKIEKILNKIIKPKIEIPKESSNIHKITDEIVNEYGHNINKILEILIDDFYGVSLLVAHNIYYDIKVVESELIRYKMETKNERKINRIETFIKDLNKNKYCTLKETVKKYGRQKDGKIKWLKLVELFKILFNKKLDNEKMHNAYYDVMVCLCCYMLHEKKINLLEENKEIGKEIRDLIIS
uniref:Exonuclease domain-containing protein n=1 Tax=viral metagenome TaxID=1070528 RepID=A0A6C0H570_9ZZZZ